VNSLRGLSPREQEILQALVTGASNKLIAIKLGITEATVKVHLKTLLRKIDVSNRTQAAIWAMNNGFVANNAVA
jgi:two-component system, NarL family, nitrate/nitrite response regulator NarL